MKRPPVDYQTWWIARNPREIEDAFAAFANKGVPAVMVAVDAVFFGQRWRIAELALANHLATMFALREYAEAGGLMSYGENIADFFRRAASFVDKIFKGAKPGDLPIEQPTTLHRLLHRDRVRWRCSQRSSRASHAGDGTSQRRVVAVGVERAAGGKERHTVVQDEARIKTQRAGTNDYQGNTTISGGTLAISSDANLGSATGILNVRGGGTLQFLANLTSDRNVTIGPGNAIFDTNAHDATLGGAITGGSGSTEFHKIGAGTLTLGGEQHLYRAAPDYCRDADPHRRQPAKHHVHANQQRRNAADRQWRRDRVAHGERYQWRLIHHQ